jgi:hypothetical protein
VAGPVGRFTTQETGEQLVTFSSSAASITRQTCSRDP